MKRWLLSGILAIGAMAALPPLIALLRDRKPTGTIAPVHRSLEGCCSSEEVPVRSGAHVDGAREPVTV